MHLIFSIQVTPMYLNLHNATLLRQQNLHLRVKVVHVVEVDDLHGGQAGPVVKEVSSYHSIS
jgi:hypothetical protein